MIINALKQNAIHTDGGIIFHQFKSNLTLAVLARRSRRAWKNCLRKFDSKGEIVDRSLGVRPAVKPIGGSREPGGLTFKRFLPNCSGGGGCTGIVGIGRIMPPGRWFGLLLPTPNVNGFPPEAHAYRKEIFATLQSLKIIQ